MSLSYRIDQDNIGKERYRFAYVAQFEKISDNLEYCYASITLPLDKTLYRSTQTINFLVYTACEISSLHKHIIVKNVQLVNMQNYKTYSYSEDDNSKRILEFLKDEILSDRYCGYFLPKVITKDNSSEFDYTGLPIIVYVNILFYDSIDYMIHKLVDQIIYNVINHSKTDVLNLPSELKSLVLKELYIYETVTNIYIKKDLDIFISNPLNLTDKELRRSWFKEDNVDDAIWNYI